MIDLSLNSMCPIMQTDLENGMTVIQLECKHCFIPEAINKWLKEEKAECPVCRFALDSKEIKDNSIQNDRYNRYDTYNTNLFPLLRYSYEETYLFNILNPPSQQHLHTYRPEQSIYSFTTPQHNIIQTNQEPIH